MSWDVILMNVPSNIESGTEFEEDLPELGSKTKVLSILSNALPSINLSDPAWGILDGDNFSIEFNMGDDDPVHTIMLHVRGSDDVTGVIDRICQHSGWRAFDTTVGDFINFAKNPTAGAGGVQWD